MRVTLRSPSLPRPSHPKGSAPPHPDSRYLGSLRRPQPLAPASAVPPGCWRRRKWGAARYPAWTGCGKSARGQRCSDLLSRCPEPFSSMPLARVPQTCVPSEVSSSRKLSLTAAQAGQELPHVPRSRAGTLGHPGTGLRPHAGLQQGQGRSHNCCVPSTRQGREGVLRDQTPPAR